MPEEVKQPLRDALALLKSGKNAASLAILADLRQAHPNVGCVWLAAAFAHDRLGREEQAIPLYLKALKLDLDAAERHNALIFLGSSYRNIGRLGNARRALVKALSRDALDPVAHLFLSLIEHDAGNPTAALRRVALAYLDESANSHLRAFQHLLKRKFKALRPVKPAAIVRRRTKPKP
jgi:tetratricopeptide (TPR) repeat protein